MGLITAGSFSRLDVFDQCKKHAELKFVHKIPEPERPPLPNGKEYPNDRGSRVHDDCENFVKGNRDAIPHEARKFKAELSKARECFESENAEGEEMWCFNDAWVPVDQFAFDEIAFRIKTDLTIFLSEEEAVIVDYKTGRRFGNEAKHGQQMKLYALGAALMFPKLKSITTELWYFDQDELAQREFTDVQAKRFLEYWNGKNMEMLSCIDFPPNPSKQSCKWCPYSLSGTGDCTQGVI
jgi:RecB family exonuclease